MEGVEGRMAVRGGGLLLAVYRYRAARREYLETGTKKKELQPLQTYLADCTSRTAPWISHRGAGRKDSCAATKSANMARPFQTNEWEERRQDGAGNEGDVIDMCRAGRI